MIKCPKCGGPCEDYVLNLEEPEPLSPKEYIKQMTGVQMRTLEMKYYQHEIKGIIRRREEEGLCSGCVGL